MAEINDKPSTLAGFASTINKELATNPNAQKVAQKATQDLSPVGSFTNYNFNREDAIRYDDSELGYLPFRNNENLYGEYQSTAEKWGVGLTKFAGKTGTAVLGNLGGMVYGIGSAIANGDITNVFDNDVTRKLSEFDEYMDTELASYYTDAEKEAGLLGRMATANFWSDKVLGGAAFVTGAIISEAIASAATAATFGGAGIAQVGLTARILDKGRKLFQAASKIDKAADVASLVTKGAIRGADDLLNVVKTASTKAPKLGSYVDDAARVTNNVFDDAVRTTGQANALNRIGTFARQQVFATGYEAGVEALHHGQEMRKEMIRKYEETYGQTIDAEALDQIDQIVKGSEISVFGANLALLTVTNMAQFKEFSYGVRDLLPQVGKMFSGKVVGKVGAKEIVEETTEAGLKKFIPGFEKWSKLRNASDLGWTIAKNPVMEGPVEEGLQGVINNTFHEYNMHKYNPAGIQNTMDFTTALGDALTKQYGTVDGWEENMIGMILGGAGIPMVRRKTNPDGTKGGFGFSMSGGIYGEIQERNEKRTDLQNRANFLQNTYDAFVTNTPDGKSKFDTIKFTNSIIQNSIESASILQQRDGFVTAGDFKRAKDADADLAFSYFKARYDTGRYESTLNETVDMIEKMTSEEFGEQFQYDPNMSKTDLESRKAETIKSFTREAESIKSALKQADTLVPQANENLRAGLAHAIYRGKNAEDRIKSISEKISFLTNRGITPEQLEKATNNEYDFAAAVIADPNTPEEQKRGVVKEYKRAKQLIREIDRLEQQYNAPVLGGLSEEELNKNLALRNKLQNDIITKKEEYLEIGRKYSAQFRVIKDVNDVRLANMIGNMKASDELESSINSYVEGQGVNSVEVESLQKDLSKLLADKVNFTRLYNYLFTKKGQEEFESIDKSIKNSLTQDYLKLINKYAVLNTSLAEEEFTRNSEAQMKLLQRVFERLDYEREQAELAGEEFDAEAAQERIYKEEYHRQRMAFLSDKYYDEVLDKAEESKTLTYAGRLVSKGGGLNLGSFAEALTPKKEEDVTKDDPKTTEELNKEITDSNADIEKVSKETGKDLNNVKALNRANKTAANTLAKYTDLKNKKEDLSEVKKDLNAKLKALEDTLDLVEKEYDKLIDENPDLDSKIEKVYLDHINEAESTVLKIQDALNSKEEEGVPSGETIDPNQKVEGDIKTIVSYPNYFAQIYRGSEKVPVPGVDFFIEKNDLINAWNNNQLIIRKTLLEQPTDIAANKFIKRKQTYSYDVIIKDESGERKVGVMSTPSSFRFLFEGKESDVNYLNPQHIKAFNSDFVDSTDELNETGKLFQEHALDILEWEKKYLIPLEENGELSTEQIKEVMDSITRNTLMSFSYMDEKPSLASTNIIREFEKNAFTIASVNAKPRYSSKETPYEELKDVKGMYYKEEEGLILITKESDGTIKEWNIDGALSIKEAFEKQLADKIATLKEHGTDRYLICKPLQDSPQVIGLMTPSFSKPISIIDGIAKLAEQESLMNVELEKNDQGLEQETKIDLGDGFVGTILPQFQKSNNEKGLPTPVILNLTSPYKGFESEAYMDPPSGQTGSPQSAFVPLIPKPGSPRDTTIGYKVRTSLQKEYTTKDKGEKPYYKLVLEFSKQTKAGPKTYYLQFFLNYKNGKVSYNPNLNGYGNIEVNTLDDFLKILYSRKVGSPETILEQVIKKQVEQDPNKKELENILNSFYVGYNPSLNKVVLRKSADTITNNLAAADAGGRVEFTKKKIDRPANPVPVTKADNNTSNGRRSRERNKNFTPNSNVPTTTPFQDFISKEFSSYINQLVSTYSKFSKDFPPSKFKEIQNIKDERQKQSILGAINQELSFLPKLDLSRFIQNGNSEFLKMLNNGPKQGEVLNSSRALFSMIVHTVPEVGMAYNNIDYLLKDIEPDFGAYSFDSPFVQNTIEFIKTKFNISDVKTEIIKDDLGEGRDATANDLSKVFNNAPRNEEGTPIINQQPPVNPSPAPAAQTNVGATPLGTVNTQAASTTLASDIEAKKAELKKQIEALPDDMIYATHVTQDDVAKKIYDTQFQFNLGTALQGTVGLSSKQGLLNLMNNLLDGNSPHRNQFGVFILAFPKSEFGEASAQRKVNLDTIESDMLDNYPEFLQGNIPTKFNFGYFKDGKLFTKSTEVSDIEGTATPVPDKKAVVEVISENYTPELLKANPDKLFLFGDNNTRTGKGGQAIIRDEPNAAGISTKLLPKNTPEAFMSDDQLADNKAVIDSDIKKAKEKAAKEGKTIVLPKGGFGTGLASLATKAPQTFAYLNKRLQEEFGFNNTTGELVALEGIVPTVIKENNNIINTSTSKKITFTDNVEIEFDGSGYMITVNGESQSVANFADIKKVLSNIEDKLGLEFNKTVEQENLLSEITKVKKVLKSFANIFAMTDEDLNKMKGAEIKTFCTI